MNPFYQDIMRDLTQGKTVVAFMASKDDRAEPEVTLFRYYEGDRSAALASTHANQRVRAVYALSSQLIGRAVGAGSGYVPEVA